ncbi:MAG: ATP-grasp domain-containing protein, partial [Candidatus Zixiibacteriota bacterium]
RVGPASSRESYLNQQRIIEVAGVTGADAIHPGYGFLAENAEFAGRCEKAGIIFIGPKSETIALLGDKLEARRTARGAGLSVVPGTDFDIRDMSKAAALADEIGYPILVKAAAGGGGKGMRIIRAGDPLIESVESAVREAGSAFGDGRVYFEKYLERPRHVEMQILADRYGRAVYLGERECSIQRRHQKVIEESPSPIMTGELRARMGKAAIDIVLASGYVGAGTVEFLVDQDHSFYFLEVNTRLQVEHPVTEMVTGIDIVRNQIRIAEGRPLDIKQEDIRPNGHAIECRIYAEDPHHDFMPSTGTVTECREPSGPGVRVDSGIVAGSEIPLFYDPIIAKLVVWGRTREEAIARSLRAILEYRIAGVRTTLDFACAVMNSRGFILGDYATDFIDREFPERQFACRDTGVEERAAIAAILYEHFSRQRVSAGSVRRGQSSSGWLQYHRGQGIKRLGGGR